MTEQINLDRRYTISIFEQKGTDLAFLAQFMPKGPMQQRNFGGHPKRVEKFIVAVRQNGSELDFDWSVTQDDPGAEKREMEAEIVLRLKARAVWIERVSDLVDQVERWAKELGWATRRVVKRIDDSWIGKHDVPALLMQEDVCKIMLEPVARSIPGTEGAVDLYLMPAYDDIASLYFSAGRWNLQYASSNGSAAPTGNDALAIPLSKEAIEKVLGELTRHAA